MHDIFSNGICKFGFQNVLKHLIQSKKFMSLDQLNTRKQIVAKQSLDDSLARMPDIEYDTKLKTFKLRTTAAEMRAFCHFFTFIAGPYVPSGDPVWEYVKSLINLVEIILLPSFELTDIDRLKQMTKWHHELFLQNFNNETLRPKHHHIVHYGRVIEKSGPICKLMCFRFEAKHKIFKCAHNIVQTKYLLHLINKSSSSV